MINTFINSRSSLKNQTRFQTKIGEVYTRFQTKMPQNPTLWGGTYLYSLFKEVFWAIFEHLSPLKPRPPPPPTAPQQGAWSQAKHKRHNSDAFRA